MEEEREKNGLELTRCPCYPAVGCVPSPRNIDGSMVYMYEERAVAYRYCGVPP